MYFNPRTPCGVRLPPLERGRRLWNFNPRTPCGVRHNGFTLELTLVEFQSTHPVWGATRAIQPWLDGPTHFNPRTPCGVRPVR